MLRAQAVQWLWAIVRELDSEEQRRFLKFFTGSDRAPIGGLGNLRCVIQRDGGDTQKLPTSHTCFNTLLPAQLPLAPRHGRAPAPGHHELRGLWVRPIYRILNTLSSSVVCHVVT